MKHVILGNGPAGVVAAEALRQAAPQHEIVMVGSENAPPYSRMAIPYLLEENIDETGTYLRKSPDYFASKLRVRELRGRAVALDTAQQKILFADGHFEHYDRLLIATCSHPVRPPIPGIDLPQVQTFWTLEDARAIGSLEIEISVGAEPGCGKSPNIEDKDDRAHKELTKPCPSGQIKLLFDKISTSPIGDKHTDISRQAHKI